MASKKESKPAAPTRPIASPERTIDIMIHVTLNGGLMKAEVQPTLHSFPLDELPRASHHCVRALTNAFQDAMDSGDK